MKEISSATIGIADGDEILFSDYVDNGPMWTAHGAREKRRSLSFSRAFRAPPTVFVTLSMWDMDNARNARIDLTTENVTETGFDMVFRTWGDTRIARARVRWMAVGALSGEDDWDIA